MWNENKEEIITLESNIISRSRLDETFLGRTQDTLEEPIASHIVIVPANKIVFPTISMIGRASHLSKFGAGYTSTHAHISRSCFEHESNLGRYKNQLEDEFGESPPLAVISNKSTSLFVRKDDSFEITQVSYSFIVGKWCFDEKMGNGRQFLQLAYVDIERNFRTDSYNEFLGFFSDNPLSTLVNRLFPKLANKRQVLDIDEKEFHAGDSSEN